MRPSLISISQQLSHYILPEFKSELWFLVGFYNACFWFLDEESNPILVSPVAQNGTIRARLHSEPARLESQLDRRQDRFPSRRSQRRGRGQPSGYEDSIYPNYLCKLSSLWTPLKQALRNSAQHY